MDFDALVRALCELGYRHSRAFDLYGDPTPIGAARDCAPVVEGTLPQFDINGQDFVVAGSIGEKRSRKGVT